LIFAVFSRALRLLQAPGLLRASMRTQRAGVDSPEELGKRTEKVYTMGALLENILWWLNPQVFDLVQEGLVADFENFGGLASVPGGLL
jgi:hypothetical protein